MFIKERILLVASLHILIADRGSGRRNEQLGKTTCPRIEKFLTGAVQIK